jgi:diguanylate cyclase (GGDEF)-like protein
MELASMLRQDDQFVGIPILFLSDEVNEVRQTAAIRVGADDFLSGDLSIKRISSAIAARADRARVLRSYMEKDGLTGLLNHSRIENQLEVEVFRAQRRNAPCSVAMIDLDGFKKINDTYGHAFGDRVLRSLSLMLRQRLRRTDFVGRWGGEEFAVVLPDTPASVAQRVLDEIRDGFSRVRHMYEGRPIFVTYSCGIAAFPDESRANRLVESADGVSRHHRHQRRGDVRGRDRVARDGLVHEPEGDDRLRAGGRPELRPGIPRPPHRPAQAGRLAAVLHPGLTHPCAPARPGSPVVGGLCH